MRETDWTGVAVGSVLMIRGREWTVTAATPTELELEGNLGTITRDHERLDLAGATVKRRAGIVAPPAVDTSSRRHVAAATTIKRKPAAEPVGPRGIDALLGEVLDGRELESIGNADGRATVPAHVLEDRRLLAAHCAKRHPGFLATPESHAAAHRNPDQDATHVHLPFPEGSSAAADAEPVNQ